MPPVDPHRPVRRWLYLMAFLVGCMVLVGGYVRLSRSGLSIVEWNVITGVLPPVGDAAWAAEFAKYRATPEYQRVNTGMSLAEYQRIFLVEWLHRFVARLVGLVLLVPLAWFAWRRRLPAGRGRVYLGILALFGFQGFLGWFMVASGLVDRPAVSHLRLSAHLLAALALLALCLWQARGLRPTPAPAPRLTGRPGPRPTAWLLLGAVLLQIFYGALVAGLKAGHVSDTWPKMFGAWWPSGLLSALQPAWLNLIEAPATVHFVHRWLGFLVLAVALWVWWRLRPAGAPDAPEARRLANWLLGLVLLQLGLGVATVLGGVALAVALAHQGNGVLVFAVTVALVQDLWEAGAGGAPGRGGA